MGARIAAKHSPIREACHGRLVAAGKRTMIALVACARMLRTSRNAIGGDQKAWRPA